MKTLSFFITVLIFAGVFAGCSSQPEPIRYGSDHCDFCKMTIVDKAHAAQMVTEKGKQFKYDAIECLVRDLITNHEQQGMAAILVADLNKPGTMLPAENAGYIITDAIPSPMGANLSAVENTEKARELAETKKGKVYAWPEIKEYFEEEPLTFDIQQ